MAPKKDNVIVVRKADKKMMEKHKQFIGPRDEFVEYTVRGARAEKLAEIAEVVKKMSVDNPMDAYKIPMPTFNAAYGPGKKGVNYVKGYLKKFGIPHPRVCPGQDIVQIWSKSAIK